MVSLEEMEEGLCCDGFEVLSPRRASVLAVNFSPILPSLCLAVKCLKNTPAFFAERLNKAMKVGEAFLGLNAGPAHS